MTNEDAIAFATSFYPRVQSALATAEANPTLPNVQRLHRQFNTIALKVAELLGQPADVFGGSSGTVHPNSGGTDKGNPA